MRKRVAIGLILLLFVSGLPVMPDFCVAGTASASWADLPNAGFEDTTAGKPQHWTATGIAESSTEQVHTGLRSVKLTDPSNVTSARLRSAKLPVQAGQPYEALVYSYNVQGTSALFVEFWDAGGNLLTVPYESNTTLNRWKEIKVYGQVPDMAAEVSLRFYLHQTNVGSAYFDDAAFRIMNVLDPLQNGDLELVSGGLPVHWRLAAGEGYSTSEKAYSGTNSVKLVDSSNTSSVSLRSNRMKIVPGQRYEASVQSFNVQGTSQLYIEFWDAGSTLLATFPASNTTLSQWSEIQASGAAPNGAVYASLRLYLHVGNVGTAYFDDAAFRAVPNDLHRDLMNGAFELVTGGKPDHWNETGGGVAVSNSVVHGGVNSVQLTDTGSSGQAALRSHLVPVEAGADYKAGVFVNAASGTAELRLEFWDANMNALLSFPSESAALHLWEELTAEGTAPESAAYASLQLGIGRDQAGVASFDDASLRRNSPVAGSKTRATYYTPDKIAAARSNVQQYAWATTLRDDAVTKADRYLSGGLEFLWNSVPAQTLPRSYGVNQQLGSPITGRAIDQYGNYPYTADPVQQPWKIVDPSSGYTFPTNDFGAYYTSGLDEHGVFRPELADRGLLVNTLYPEKGAGWGVDDGFGWVDDQGIRYTFIAYYVHWFLWYKTGMIQDALIAFKDAYLYTGDMKYARAGTIMLDRVADVYPELDVSAYNRTLYLNSHGGTGRGKAVGSIWETELVKEFIGAYDAFYPAVGDPQIVAFLGAKSQQYRLTNPKSGGGDIRRNIEDGIVKQVYPSVKSAHIHGNDGMHQSALAMAAVVYDTLPHTKEWLDFTFRSGGLLTNPYRVTGGNIWNSLVSNVDRDGSGNEAAPGYNALWLSRHQLTADLLDGYDLYQAGDLYQNVKFRKMFSALYPLTLSEAYTANIGDSGYTGNPGISVKLSDMVKAFDRFGDPVFAQMAYFLNYNRADGIHKDVFSNNPEQVSDQIRSVIAEHGPLDLKSSHLSGYGFAALRDGQSHSQRFGIPYEFPFMPVTAGNTPHKLFAESGTVQLEASAPGATITFGFQVPATDEYDIDLLPFKAATYGIYRISIDGQPVKELDFYGGRTDDFETIVRMTLTAGTHHITFESIGKNPAAGNYKMGVRTLSLLDEQARALRDQANAQGNTLRDFWMYYGRTSGHGHRDALNVGVHAFGLDLAPDLGYPEFADNLDKHRHQWVNNTISHNTVVVDQRKQEAQWVADPKHFDDTERVKLIDVEAPDAYPQTDLYKRTTVMIQVYDTASYAVDFFRVSGGNDHHFSFHGAEGTVATEGLAMVGQPTGTYAGPNVGYGERVDDVDGRGYMGSGFHYLKNVSRDANPASSFSADWAVEDTWNVLSEPEDIHLRLTMLGDLDEVALADGVPPQNKPGNPETLRYLIARRSGTNLDSLFASVMEPYKNERFIHSIGSAVVREGGAIVDSPDVKAVKVELTDGRTDYIVYSLNPDTEYTIDGKIRFKGFLGVYSELDGEQVYGYIHDSAYMIPVSAPAVPAAAARLEGTVIDFTRVLSVSNHMDIQMAVYGGGVPDVIGKWIFVDNDGVRNAAYEIKDVTPLGGGLYRLSVGDATFVRSYVNAADFSQGFVYDIAAGSAFRIPLTAQTYAAAPFP
ncbi:heparinase II/III domain-containing protein [Paenibacillus oceani]|uniref:Heparinase II/III family protein n=1 Tax=Paenibacillus oceani TaxID=2772510 RepID=A0A927CAT4_9BACL|nr:heparinase II/III family protein [Paenibacillus oceani]MBD2864614.1 heparinase II/III family protein [Paenibacillus oceani]